MASRGRHLGSHGSDLRASDADRERVAAALRDHFGAGRLSEDDLSERIDATYGARTMFELEALTDDLPSARQQGHRRRRSGYETGFRTHLSVYIVVNLMLIGIWAASGGGYFWPIWPMLGWGIGVGSHGAPLLAKRGAPPRHRSPRALETNHRPRHRPDPLSSVDEVASSVAAERPSLRSATAPDGTVTILFSDIEGSTALNERLGDVRWRATARAQRRRPRAGEGGRRVRGQVAGRRLHGRLPERAPGDPVRARDPGGDRA
jgi:hypothetical protein